ncbi:MAG: RNA methyltransferase [Prevotella sp.]|nr:RNA methyltransferase [Prevotella sp.]
MISKNQIKYIRQLEMKKFRSREGLFVAEGPKVVGDLLRRYDAKAIYATEEWNPSPGVSLSSVERITVDELRRISFLQHPQQVLALFPIPKSDSSSSISKLTSSLSLALDGIQDPGNLGTIIRIADWFGIDTIYCSEDTADAYNPKVVQATMGSLARVNIIYISLASLFDGLPDDFPVYGTLLDGEDIYQQPLSQNGIIVMGNEGNGISPEIRTKVNRRLLIPRFRTGDSAESLNVAIATAITCSEFRRR